MKRIYPLIICFVFASICLHAQGIVFEKTTWADVVKKAKKQKKLIFLHFDSPRCEGCNQVASVAFNSPLISEKFAINFISFRTDGTTGIGKELAEKLDVDCIPSSIYLDSDENPLVRYCGTTSFDRMYLEKAEEAISQNREKPFGPLTQAYQKGDRSPAFMRKYLERRQEIGLSNDGLLDDYVRQLPADSLRSGSVLRFIFEQAPIVGSKADSVFRSNYAKMDSLYRAVGNKKAVELNNQITNNSLRKAIKEKDNRLADRTALFRMRTYGNDYKNGLAAMEWVMMRYHRGINDTLQYLRVASHYYDTQFMTARVDSIQKLDELDNQRRMRGEMPPGIGAVKPGSRSTQIVAVRPFPNTQRYVSALNQAAWDFQEMTRDTMFLNKALRWSKRSLEYREDGSLLDTYAHVLYRLGRRQEAIEWQEKAVSKEKERNSPLLTTLEQTLKKMKNGTL